MQYSASFLAWRPCPHQHSTDLSFFTRLLYRLKKMLRYLPDTPIPRYNGYARGNVVKIHGGPATVTAILLSSMPRVRFPEGGSGRRRPSARKPRAHGYDLRSRVGALSISRTPVSRLSDGFFLCPDNRK